VDHTATVRRDPTCDSGAAHRVVLSHPRHRLPRHHRLRRKVVQTAAGGEAGEGIPPRVLFEDRVDRVAAEKTRPNERWTMVEEATCRTDPGRSA